MRFYDEGIETRCYTGHAEMILCDRINFKRSDTVYVVRFLSDGTQTMAKPCRFCQRYLYNSGIRRVRYTDWKGSWKKMNLSQIL
jgi:hypothetical protein